MGTSRENEWLLALNSNPEKGIEVMYKALKKEYLAYTAKFSADQSLRQSSYHHAVLQFYELFRDGRYDQDRASIKTLLFKIGQNRLLGLLRREKRQDEVTWSEAETLEVPEEMLQRARAGLLSLGDSCRRMIELFYYFNYSIHAIKEEMGYANENAVKADKSRCMKKLREIVNPSLKQQPATDD